MRDEKPILAQDDDFLWLALEPGLPASRIQVKDSTLKESMSLPLKTGSRPPYLFMSSDQQKLIGDTAQLIVEVKSGNPDAAMHSIRREFECWF